MLCCFRDKPSPQRLLGTQPEAEAAPRFFSWSPYLSGGSPISRGAASLHQDYSKLFKILIVGDEVVGKTSIRSQFTERRFQRLHEVNCSGAGFGSRTLDFDGQKMKLQIWDVAGQDRFRSVIRMYYHGAVGALVVYDITRRESFDHVPMWLAELRKITALTSIVLIGNKSELDTERQVTVEEGQRLACQHGLTFLETSAARGENIDEVFFALLHDVHEQEETAPPQRLAE
ncbi:YPTC4 [Symbiodinium sp. CCMP2592]|nr:YPTC4 [Symbiodinium sp. CCMP2592]